MTGARRAAAGLATLVLGAGLLLTACGPNASGPNQAKQPAATSSEDAQQVQDMQQKVDSAESAAAQAETDATQNN
ncbi:hypothetical protein [Kitasatospora sp. McL0602]|uniref:hypothetical protein n=1 Tax=Kitasatospora sp. McL0602 TaxID=3439530 RepID=UPI003F8C7C72